jgi:hypothetical protein
MIDITRKLEKLISRIEHEEINKNQLLIELEEIATDLSLC